MNALKDVRKLTVLAIFVALTIIFSQFLAINLPGKKFSFTFFVTATMCSVFNMPLCFVAVIVADLVGNSLFPSPSGFYPLFLLPKIVTVIIYGYFFYRKKVTAPKAALAGALNYLIANFVLNTWVICQMNHSPLLAMLPVRIPALVVNLPLNTVGLCLLLPKIVPLVRRELRKIGVWEFSEII